MMRAEEAFSARQVGDLVVGQEAADLRYNLEVSYPVSNGIIQNWDDMHHIWEHTFQDVLNCNPTECRILLTDPPLNPLKNREQMVETMFETFGFNSAFVQTQAVLTTRPPSQSIKRREVRDNEKRPTRGKHDARVGPPLRKSRH